MKILSALTAILLTVSLSAHERNLTISGTAKVMVNADEMVISTGLSYENDDAAQLQQNMQNKMAEALK